MQLEIPFPAVLCVCLIAAIYALVIYLPGLFGYLVSIGSIRPTSLHHLKYKHGNSCSISVKTVRIKLHVPRSKDPHWAKIFVEDGEYQDDRCAVSFHEGIVTLWFFPLLYGYTAGPLVSFFGDDFRVEVFQSSRTPNWIAPLRDNLIYTIVNEETVRIHDLDSRVTFGTITGSKEGYEGEVEKPGMRDDEEFNDFRFRVKANQWHIYNSRNHRMYTFNVLEAEIRRCWAENRGKLVLIAHNSQWTKLPVLERQRLPAFQHIIRSLIQAPGDLKRIIFDPLLTVNLDMSRCDITFDDFRFRDSAFDEQVVTLIQRHYGDSRSQVLLSEGSLDMLVRGVVSLCI